MYTMKQACERVGMTYEALKFYCNQGLVPNVKRGKNNYRMFDDRDIEWIKGLICLKRCGMSIENIKLYLALCKQGQSSIPERKIILEKQRKLLIEKMEDLKKDISYIDQKQAFYDDVLLGKVKYTSNLIDTDD